MRRCLPLRGAWTRRFRAILEICAMARSLPHNCFASCSKVFPGKAEATATLFAARAALAAISALATATSRSSSTTFSCIAVHVSWRLRRTYAARHAAARADSSLCVRRSPRGSITVGANGGESDSVSGSVSSSRSDRREQMWRTDVASSRGEQMWQADLGEQLAHQACHADVPSRCTEQTCRVDVPSRRAEQIAPMGLRRASRGVLACWSRRAGRGRIAETGERVAEVGVRDHGVAREPSCGEHSWRAHLLSCCVLATAGAARRAI